MYIFVFPTGIDIILENKVLNYKISVCVLFAMCILQNQCVCAVCHVYTTKSVCMCCCPVHTTKSVCLLFAMCILQNQCVCCLPCVFSSGKYEHGLFFCV